MRVLIIEDDDRVAGALVAYLTQAGYSTVRAEDGETALAVLGSDTELVLLDLRLPDIDGFDLCRRIRHRTAAPVIMATARGQVSERVEGLRAGADDYVVKPYDVRELVARIEAVTRRERPLECPMHEPSREVVVDGIRIDLANRKVLVEDASIGLTPKEFEIVALLARYPGVAIPRERIVREVWQTNWRGFGHSLEVHVGAIRRKLGNSDVIQTVRGVGYRLAGT